MLKIEGLLETRHAQRVRPFARESCGDDDDRDVAQTGLGLDRMKRVPAMTVRHHHIQDNQGRLLRLQQFEHAVATAGKQHTVPLFFKHVPDDLLDERFIIYHENSLHGVSTRLSSNGNSRKSLLCLKYVHVMCRELGRRSVLIHGLSNQYPSLAHPWPPFFQDHFFQPAIDAGVEKALSDKQPVAYGIGSVVEVSLEKAIGAPHDANYALLYALYKLNTVVSGCVHKWAGGVTGAGWRINHYGSGRPDYPGTGKTDAGE